MLSAYAERPADLMQVYQDALYNDPSFQKAESDWLSAREDLSIATSGYLPQINLQVLIAKNWQHDSGIILYSTGNGIFTAGTYTLQLNQAIFNYSIWHQIKEAHATVKAALATYFAAAQDLMVRTAIAYFNVLKAHDKLLITVANKNTLLERLNTAKEKFRVGLIAITDVYEAQAAYDQAIATQITDQNNLNNQIENLRVITGKHYYSLKGVGHLPLITPIPNNIDLWSQMAEEHNYQLMAQNYTTIAAEQEIKVQLGNGLPTLGIAAQYQDIRWSGLPNLGVNRVNNVNNQTGFAGVAINAPIFRGGLTVAKTRQARYNYLSASSQLEFVHRDVINKTRQNFLGVLTGISQIVADKASIVSAKNALEATKVGYSVGTRTMIDVLNEITTLYQAQQQFANDQYSYILSTIQLKQATSALDNLDFEKLNCWLTKTINFPVPQSEGDPTQTLDEIKTNSQPSLSVQPSHKNFIKPKKIMKTAPKNKIMSKNNPAYYLIHLYADSQKGAQEFIDKQPLIIRNKLHMNKVGDLYKVVYGEYPTFSAAKLGLQQLPQTIKQYQPWIARDK